MKIQRDGKHFVFERGGTLVTNEMIEGRLKGLHSRLRNSTEFGLFWKGFLSQWHMQEFTADAGDLGTLRFNCCEQFMMAHKALLFKDKKAFKKIMNAPHPSKQKGLGKKVQNFNSKLWENNRMIIVYAANMFRFSESQEVKGKLLRAKGDVLAEASPFDKIWGIGMKASEAAKDPRNWKGKNLLGFALTIVREDLS